MLASNHIRAGRRIVAERREDLRAADVDRQFVADRLKTALDEGRLSLHEYDDRLKETYAARTYGDLDRVLEDLPGADRAQLVPPPPGHTNAPPLAAGPAAPTPQRSGIPKWVWATWSSWLSVSIIVNAIWLATVLNGGHADYWPIWVMLPWGAVLLAGTITGLATGTGQARWESRQAARRDREQRRRDRRGR
jgi:Domain of unknown function (DUF1707)